MNEIKKGSISMLPFEIILFILEEKGCDPICQACEYGTDGNC